MVLIFVGQLILFKAPKPVFIEAPASLENYLIPIKTTKAGNGFGDLQSVGEPIKDKKIIAMGEATHGTKEFFEMRHRMFEYLVEEMGYRVFAIEDQFGNAQVVNDYILYGHGNLNDAIKVLFTIWQTEEVANMIQWMREYNDNPENASKIKFYGFDMQSEAVDRSRVQAYLAKVEKDTSTFWYDYELYTELIEKNRESYIEQTSIEEYQLIEQHLNIITQNREYRVAKAREKFNIRDFYMAQNVKWILDYEKQYGNDRIMLWAHNGHVAKEIEIPTLKSMGQHLFEMYDEDYYSIGFDFYHGKFRARPMRIIGGAIGRKLAEFEIKPNTKLFAFNFHKMGIPISYIDFNSATKDIELQDWLSKTHSLRSIGAGYLPIGRWSTPQTPIRIYDALIFIDETTAAVGINGAESSAMKGPLIIALYHSKIVILIVLISFMIKRRKKKQVTS